MAASKTSVKPSVNLDQWADGAAPDLPVSTGSQADQWQNGNLGSSQAHYSEGESVPYRAVFSNATEGTLYALTIEWDTTQQGKHALDYLTSWDASFPSSRNETLPNPLIGVSGLLTTGSANFGIVADPRVTAGPDGNLLAAGDNIVQPSGQNFSFFGGIDPSSIHYVQSFGADGKPGGSGANADTYYSGSFDPYTLTGSYAGNSSTSVTLVFTYVGDGDTVLGETGSMVLAWGGHIATRVDWGSGMSAAAISGSPYHMRLTSFLDSDPNTSESVGQQDRSLSSAAVTFPGAITVEKQTSPDGSSQVFNFELTRPANTVDVIAGKLDTSGDGVIDGKDDGRFTDSDGDIFSVTDGGAIADTNSVGDGKLAGFSLVGGLVDVNASGSITVDDKYTNLTGVGVATFSLTDGQSQTFNKLAEFGNYTVKEVVPAQWDLTSIGTSKTDINNVTTTGTISNPAGDQTTISLAEADTYKLTFNDAFAGAPHIDVTKTNAGVVDGDSNGPDAGDTIVYSYALKNDGNIALLNVSASDDQLGALTLSGLSDLDADGQADDLAVGATATATKTATLTQAQVDAGSVTNIATGSGTGADGTPVSDTDTNTVTIARSPHIDITKTNAGVVDGDSNGPDAGDTIVYSYTLKNDGNISLLNVSASDDQLGALTLGGLSGLDADGTADDLAVGATATATKTATLTQAQIDAGSVTNIATGSGTGADGTPVSDTDSNTVTIAQNPHIDIEKYVSVDGGASYFDADSPAGPTLLNGSNPLYKFVVTNTGNVTLSNVTLHDHDVTNNADLDLNGGLAGNDLNIGSLAAGATYTLTDFAGVYHSGQQTDTATATGTLGGQSLSDSDDANYFGFQPIEFTGHPQFNFPNSVDKIQPKLQGGSFTINSKADIYWDFFTSNSDLAQIDVRSGTFSSDYSGLKVSIIKIWDDGGAAGTGADAIYRVYVANETSSPISLANNTNIVSYNIVNTSLEPALSTDKGLLDLVNSDPLIGNFNNFSNIENALTKDATDHFLTNPTPPLTNGADRVWTSADETGTAVNEAAASFDGLGGNDALYGRNNGSGADALSGGDGNDMIDGRDGVDSINGGTGNDFLFGSLSNDTIVGGAGNDTLFGSYGHDTLTGGTGADIFILRHGDFDTITDFSASEGDTLKVWVDTLDNTAAAGHTSSYDAGTGILSIDGSPVVQLLGNPPLADVNSHLVIT